MTDHLYILGRTPLLALAELQTFIRDAKLIAPDIALSSAALPLSADLFLSKLGGTVKIAEFSGNVAEVTPETLAPYIDTTHGRVVFGVSMYGEESGVPRGMLENIKRLLEGRGASVRFVESRHGNTLSSVVIDKDHIQELVVVKTDGPYVVGKTLAVQPFEDWGTRDFGRPHADPKAGMLPPKVSRMVVNIAGQTRDLSQTLAQKTILDPFCGMGTVISEALVMGWNVVGGDQSKEVIEKARANIRWLMDHHLAAEGVTYRLHAVDAVHISDVVGASVDAIVTEPYMGPTEVATRQKEPKELQNIVKGLEKLYIGCLKDWHKILKKDGIVVIALPLYQIGQKTYFVKKVVDMCEILGYTIVTGPIEYSRPQAVVKRSFYILRKK